MEEKIWDVGIVGGGPCGVTSAIYLKRANKEVVIVEKNTIGGQVGWTCEVKNYPGYLGGDGFGLAQQFSKQLEENEIPIIKSQVLGIEDFGDYKLLKLDSEEIKCKRVILSLGAGSRKLGLPNEAKFEGRGISYCAVCDGHLYKGKDVAVVGGGNSAMENVMYLSALVNKVHLIHLKKSLRVETTEKVLVDEVEDFLCEKDCNIVTHFPYIVSAIEGSDRLEALDIRNTETGVHQKINVDALFISIGRTPSSHWLPEEFRRDEAGYIIVNENFETSVNGVYAGGDCIRKNLRQIVTAVSDGALIATNIIRKR